MKKINDSFFERLFKNVHCEIAILELFTTFPVSCGDLCTDTLTLPSKRV